MAAAYEEPEVSLVSARELASSAAYLTSGGSTPGGGGVSYGTEDNPYPMTAGSWTKETSISSEHWMKCEVGGSMDLRLILSGSVGVNIYCDSKTNLVQSGTRSGSSSAQFNEQGVHTYYLRLSSASSATAQVMCEQHVDTCTDLTRRIWEEQEGSGYVSKEFQTKQFFTSEEVPGLIYALDVDTIWDTVESYINGEINEEPVKWAFEQKGCYRISGIIDFISSVNTLLDLVGRERLVQAILVHSNVYDPTPVAISFYQDDSISFYWTYEVEQWDGVVMYGCPGARGVFEQSDYYWFE